MLCADCGAYFHGDKCACGWVMPRTTFERHNTCAWIDSKGFRCARIGTVSPHLYPRQGEQDKRYCGFHLQCLNDPSMANYPEAEKLFFETQERLYPRRKHENSDCWLVGDIWQLKGLLVTGVGSQAWNKAPKEVQDAALKLKEWKPPDRKMPEIPKVEQQEIAAAKDYEPF